MMHLQGVCNKVLAAVAARHQTLGALSRFVLCEVPPLDFHPALIFTVYWLKPTTTRMVLKIASV
jgi:hypothetical protein